MNETEARRAARRWRIWARVVPLGAEPKGDLLRHSTAAERLALVGELTVTVSRLARRSSARPARGTPIRVIPLADH